MKEPTYVIPLGQAVRLAWWGVKAGAHNVPARRWYRIPYAFIAILWSLLRMKFRLVADGNGGVTAEATKDA